MGASAQVEAFLNRHEDGADAVVKCIVEAVEELGFRSWAYRIINTAGGAPCWELTGGLRWLWLALAMNVTLTHILTKF